MKLGTKICVGLTLLAAGLARTASASVTYGFYAVANEGTNVNTATASQYLVEVIDAGGSNVDFRFTNPATPVYGSITDVYFDDGTLLGISSVTGVGIDGWQHPDPPEDLPGGTSVTPAFEASQSFNAGTSSGGPSNGVDGLGEYVTIHFALQSGFLYADTLAALASGELRIGIHVTGFGNGGSESFIENPVPLPAEATMAGIGMIGLVGVRAVRRRRA